MLARLALLVVVAALAGCAQQPVKQTTREPVIATADAGDALEQAQSLMRQHKFAEAQQVLQHFTATMPPAWQSVVEHDDRIDIAYWDTREMLACSLTEAKRAGKDVVWVRPSYSKAWYLLGFMAVERGDYAEANKDLDHGLALEPDHPTLLNEKATIEQQTGKHAESIAFNRKVIESKRCVTKEALSRAWRSQAVSLTELGKLDEAENALDESLKVDPGNADTEREFIYIQRLRANKPKVPVTIHDVH
jgi:tetratricopeptide (TPR) repeat protein